LGQTSGGDPAAPAGSPHTSTAAGRGLPDQREIQMEFRRVGESGLSASVVGLGCNQFGRRVDAAQARNVVAAALEAGITFFDTADTYGEGRSEEFLGAALGRRRDDVVVATKFGGVMAEGPFGSGGSRRYVRTAVEASLSRLGTDWIDLYQFHFPDLETPIEETLGVLDDLVREGKVRYLGCSNFSGWQIADADWTAYHHRFSRFISAQNRYSLLDRAVEAEVVPACENFGVGLIPYAPLAKGLLTGRYHRGEPAPEGSRLSGSAGEELLTDENFDLLDKLEAYAKERGTDLLGVAIGGLAAQPSVASVIAGASAPDQVIANVAAAAWEPSPEDLEALDEIVPPARPSE
jgi:aryl-alcohol dehydrogenase-like predicted oxidoreductase